MNTYRLNSRLCIYVLRCVDSTYYVGYTRNLKRTLAMHEIGRGGMYTAQRLPLKLVWVEELEQTQRVRSRIREIRKALFIQQIQEAALKRGKRRKVPYG